MVAERDQLRTYKYERGAVDPDLEVTWRDSRRQLVPFDDEPHSFTLTLAALAAPDTAVLTKTTGFLTDPDAPNLRVQWQTSDLDRTPGLYIATLRALRLNTNRRRQPLQFRIKITDPLGTA